jgi:hypothetical protein
LRAVNLLRLAGHNRSDCRKDIPADAFIEEMVEQLRSYPKNEDEVLNLLQYHQKAMVNPVHAQMRDDCEEKATAYEAHVCITLPTVPGQSGDFPRGAWQAPARSGVRATCSPPARRAAAGSHWPRAAGRGAPCRARNRAGRARARACSPDWYSRTT